ncbi:hypothetical protein [Archangium lansingense]|uniref:Lipoprotein n=1 Tax=Archangium lansingense TaxID=2995310 RepID=A0ABT4A6A3_9BACT|nr:hypothetical protein [Archangium lansinium]MCY1077183.1 hypothetical protein [Archangium lansinium]
MKRLIVSLMVVAGALLSACTEEEEFRQTVGLAGPYDVALVQQDEGVPELLFVTSTDTNELRVLELAKEQVDRRFVRAPNPLQSLAIPVLPRPQSLTRDVRYDENGQERTGRLVFARSSGSTEISVVAADHKELREVRRLRTPRMTGTSVGPVTAFAALAPEQVGGQTRLYFATQETTGARLWLALLPDRERLLAEVDAEEDARTPVEVLPLEGLVLPENVAVNSLLVLPSPVGQDHPGVLAVATRGTGGTVYRVDLGSKVVQTLNFGGAQVLYLATHGRTQYDVVVQTSKAPKTRVTESRTLEAGARIFGVLDPSNCSVLLQCTGVLAVDVATGQVAKDRTALDANDNLVSLYDMMSLTSGAGLPTGLSVVTDRNLVVQSGEPMNVFDPDPANADRRRGPTLPVLGIVPLSNGTILFFDALNLIHLNVKAIWTAEQTKNTPTATTVLANAQGTTLDENTRDEITFSGTFGVTRDQTYVLTYQGILPEMSSVARAADDSFKVPFEPQPGLGQVVQPGDIIVLLSAETGGQVCATDVTVLAVQPRDADNKVTLVPSGNLPPACADYDYFQVRAGGAQSLVVSSSSEGYVARLGAGGEVSRTGPYFFHPPGYAGLSEDVAVRLKVERQNLDDGDPGRGFVDLARGDRYVVTIDSHFLSYIISVDTSVGDLFFFRLPGPVVQATVDNDDFAYIVYPSANGVLEVDLSSITAGVLNSRGLFPYL